MAAIMSSGKSSSMAAVLMLVAVVAASCASGAQAEFNITNLCNNTVVITTATGTANSTCNTLILGATLLWPALPNTFFINPFTITIKSNPPVTVIIGPNYLDGLNQLGDRLRKVEIRCNGKCITLNVTYTPVNQTTDTTTADTFCP